MKCLNCNESSAPDSFFCHACQPGPPTRWERAAEWLGAFLSGLFTLAVLIALATFLMLLGSALE